MLRSEAPRYCSKWPSTSFLVHDDRCVFHLCVLRDRRAHVPSAQVNRVKAIKVMCKWALREDAIAGDVDVSIVWNYQTMADTDHQWWASLRIPPKISSQLMLRWAPSFNFLNEIL